MRAVELDKALLAACKGCNEEFSEEPCEPGCCRIRERLENLPRVTLDDLRPKGRWIEGYPVTCSNCGHSAETLYDDCNIYQAIRTPFCSYCGADMRGGGEDG